MDRRHRSFTRAIAAASTGAGRTPINCMDTKWRTDEVSTSSTSWKTIPGFTDSPNAIFPIAVNVSATVSGAPVRFRVKSTNVGAVTKLAKPGATRFVPHGASAFSYQWIEKNQSAAEHSVLIRLQWKSPMGKPVHLLKGDASFLYQTTGCH
jgi:hypothetical protein